MTAQQLGELKEWLVEVPLEPLHFGILTLKSVPSSEATIYSVESGRAVASDARPVAVLRTPIEDLKFPTGTFEVHLENKVLGMGKVLSVVVLENRIISVDERLDVTKK